MNICSPAPNASVSSPVSFQAAATPISGRKITGMKVYIDGVSQYSTSTATVSTSLTIAAGTHAVTVKAWDNTGVTYSAKESITVTANSNTAPFGYIDDATVSGTTLATRGWAADYQDGSPVAKVVVLVDGKAVGNATLGDSRPDLYANDPRFVNGGWHFSFDVTAFSTATHTLSAVAYDSGGLTGTLGNTFTFQGTATNTCSPTAGVVTICQPAANATVSSPVTFQAVAGNPAGQQITAMRLYVDSVSQTTVYTAQLNATVTLAAGTHNVVVNAWTNTGAVIQARETITVTTSTTPSVNVSPSSATVEVGKTQQFSATVMNLSSTTVTWSVDGVNGGNSTVGTISTTGLYTAPAAVGTHTVKATSTADTTKFDTSTVDVVATPPVTGPEVTTYMYNNGRTGLNAAETTLTPAAVTGGAFTKRGTWTLDAASYTQPLFLPSVSVGSGTYNVLFVATENDSVYALDADHPGTVLWKRNLIPSGATIGNSYACSGTTCDGRSSDLGATVGITGTPVIDKNNGWLYVVAKTTENSTQVYRLHALDIRNGQDVMASAIVRGSVSGTGDGSSGGTLNFNALTHNQRAGLLLDNGVVYLTFASYSDHPPYHGWVIAYNASNLTYIDAYADTPNTDGGGIWAAGAAPAADANGNVYIATANQLPYSSGFPNIPTEIPNSVIKLKLVNGSLSLVDYFVPYNTQCLTNDDLDLGSTSPMLIPDTFAGHQMATVASKEGRVYLLDSNNLGKFHSGSDSQILGSHLFNPQGACGSTNFSADSPWRVYGGAAYWNGNIYFGSAFGPLRQYNITNATLQQVALGSHTYPASGQSGRGPLTVVSSNGNAGAVVWTLENDYSTKLGWLRAYDATNVSRQLYSNSFGNGANFVIPTVTNGHVYFPSMNVIYSYGVN